MQSPKWIRTKAHLFLILSIACISIHSRAGSWSEHDSKLGMMKRQIEMGEHEIHSLIEQKKHTDDAEKVAEIMRSIGDRHKAVTKTSKDYAEERQHVRFEHPEKNDQLDCNYVRHEVKSLESMEGTVGIDSRLDHIRALVRAKFPVEEKQESSAEAQPFRTRLPAAHKAASDDEAPEKIKLVK